MKTTNRQRRSHLAFNQSESWALWKSWVLATAIAQVIGMSLTAVISAANYHLASTHLNATVFLIGALKGLCLGFFQWLVLRRYLQHSVWWIAATIVGASLAWLLIVSAILIVAILDASTIYHMPHRLYLQGVALFGLGAGAILGFSQWCVLRLSFRRSFVWIIANALAWSVGLIAGFMNADSIYADDVGFNRFLLRFAIAGAVGAIVGVITGFALLWIRAKRST